MKHTVTLNFTDDARWAAITKAAEASGKTVGQYIKDAAYQAATFTVADGGTP